MRSKIFIRNKLNKIPLDILSFYVNFTLLNLKTFEEKYKASLNSSPKILYPTGIVFIAKADINQAWGIRT